MGKTWKNGGEKSRPRASRLDREQERRICRGRVEWEDEDLDEGSEETTVGGLGTDPDQEDVA